MDGAANGFARAGDRNSGKSVTLALLEDSLFAVYPSTSRAITEILPADTPWSTPDTAIPSWPWGAGLPEFFIFRFHSSFPGAVAPMRRGDSGSSTSERRKRGSPETRFPGRHERQLILAKEPGVS
jgi:hypothetical protein